MALMIGELYEALRLAQVPDDKARAAAIQSPTSSAGSAESRLWSR
jgi:hypothetical protein